MTLLILFSLTCLFSITKTKQSPLNDYMQMIYHQPTVYQHLLATSYPAPQPYHHHAHAHHIPHHHANSFNHNRYMIQPVAAALDYAYPPQQVTFKATVPQSTVSTATLARLHRSAQQQQQQQQASTRTVSNGINDHHHDNKLINLKLEGAKSVIPLQNMVMRNHHLNQQLLIQSEPSPSNNYNSHPSAPSTPFVDASSAASNGGGVLTSSSTSSGGLNGAIAMAAEAADDPAMVAANLIDSLDVDEHNGGHFDYTYQERDQPQFTTVSAINNNSLALFRLLNFIDQSPSSMPLHSSKTSLDRPISTNSANINKSQAAAANANLNLNLNRHQASQSTLNSIPNYLNSNNNNNNWSRKRDNQMHWRQQNQNQNHHQHHLVDMTNQAKQAHNSQLVDSLSNTIELQPEALKMMKTSSYSNTPPRSSSSSSSSSSQTASSSRKNNNNNNNNSNNSYSNSNDGHQHSNGHANGGIGADSNGSNNNLNSNNNFNNDDTGFGNKQSSNSEKLNGPLTSSTSLNSKVPHDADSEMIAANNAPRCDKFTPDICVDDFEYPEQAIIDEIQKKRDVFELMYSEVKDNEPLVDGIPRDVEESYNYDYYYYGKPNLSQAASQISPQMASTISLSGSGFRSTPSSSSAEGVSSASGSPSLSGVGDDSSSSQPIASSSSSSSLLSGINISDSGSGGIPAADPDQDTVSLAGSHNHAQAGSIRSRVIGSIQDAITSDKTGNLSMMNGNQPLASSIDGMDALIGAITSHASSSSVSAQSPPTTGFICPSEVMYGKPKLAKNKKGLWKVIVNAGEFTQTVRLEKCLLPNKKCNYVSTTYESRCAQVHSYHRLLVFEKGRGFYIDTFRLPTGCNCHVTKKAGMIGGSGSGSSSGGRAVSASGSGGRSTAATDTGGDQASFNSSPILPGARLSSAGVLNSNNMPARQRASSSESMLSQTLWSILSGGASAISSGSGIGGGIGAGSSISNGGNGGGGGNLLNQYSNQAGGITSSSNGNSEDSTNNHVRNSYHHHHHQSANNNNYNNNNNNNNHMNLNNLNSNPNTFNSNNMLNDDMSPAQREAYQSQSAILDHLSQNPALAANISDSVLRQLIDVGQISALSGSAHAPQLLKQNPPIHRSTSGAAPAGANSAAVGASCQIC